MEPVKEFSHIQCIWNCACVLVSLSPTAFYLFKQKHVEINTFSLYFIIKGLRINGSFDLRRKQIIGPERVEKRYNARGGKRFIIYMTLKLPSSSKLHYKRANESTSVWRIKAESSVRFFFSRIACEAGFIVSSEN